MYILVRKDLPPSQIAVQAAHAAIEAAKAFLNNDSEAEHPHLVLCESPDELFLLNAAGALDKGGIRCRMFYEADRNNEATALATETVYGKDRRAFKNWKLLNIKEKLVGTI